VKIKRLNDVKLLRALTTNMGLGALHHLPLRLLLLALKVNPTLSAVKEAPGIILAISSGNRVILGIRKLVTALLARKIATLLTMRNIIRFPGRLAHGLELDAILVDVNTLCVSVRVRVGEETAINQPCLSGKKRETRGRVLITQRDNKA